MFSDYKEAHDWLEARINHERTGPSSRMGERTIRLENLRKQMDLMDNPQEKFDGLHITGTNGKTTVARLATQILLAHHNTVGTYSSPHLQRLTERILINGEEISQEELTECFYALSLYESEYPELKMSYFEVLTAAAFRVFADAPVDFGVIEVGVGGLFDATNIMDAKVSLITNIGSDHANYLGPSPEDVSMHKSGIVKPGSIAIVGRQREFDKDVEEKSPDKVYRLGEQFDIVESKFAVGGQVLTVATNRESYENIFVPLQGQYNLDNIAMSIAACEELLESPLDKSALQVALNGFKNTGRAEVLKREPLVMCDGAHNKEAASCLGEMLRDSFSTKKKWILVFGMLEPHDPNLFLDAIGTDDVRIVIATKVDNPRAVPTKTIAAAASAKGIPVVEYETVNLALSHAVSLADENDLVLVTGSLYVAGEARSVELN